MGIIFLTFYAVVKLLCDNSIKRMLIRNNLVDKSDKLIINNSLEKSQSGRMSLKWGIVALFGGIGILIATSLGTWLNSFGHENGTHLEEGVSLAIVIIFISAGFLTSFFVERKIKD